GLQGSFLDKTIDVNKFKPIDQGDQVLLNWQSNITTDFGFGMYYFIKEKVYAGFSTSQLSESTVENTSTPSTFSLTRHYFIQGGYQWTLPSNPSFQILPSVLVKTDFTSAQYDINALLLYNNRFWGGLSYRIQDAVVILLGMNWKNFRFGYSYDLTTSAIGSEGRSSGSHEIMLRYCFTIKIPVYETEYHNSRFFDDIKK
ncbi:PorP/SprF family type IX secretion system membrane protein, partial [Bacteroidota bacterium]